MELLNRGYELWAQSRGRSIEDWVAIAHPDFEVRSLADGHPEGHFGAVPAGHDGLRKYLTELVLHWIMEDFVIQQYVADGDNVVAVARTAWRNRATNKQVSTVLVDVWTFRDGQAVSLLELFDTAAMIQATLPDAA